MKATLIFLISLSLLGQISGNPWWKDFLLDPIVNLHKARLFVRENMNTYFTQGISKQNQNSTQINVSDLPPICDPDSSTANICFLISATYMETQTMEIDCGLKEFSVIGTNVNIECVKDPSIDQISFQIFERCKEKDPNFKFT